MKKSIIFSAIALSLLCSCSTVKKTAQTAEVNTAIIQYPTVTDLEVLEPATMSTSWSWNPFVRTSLKTRKSNLVANLLKEQGADVLLEERYIVESDGLGGGRLTVTGYPAKFKGFRKATPADLEAIKAVNSTVYNLTRKNDR